MTAPRGYRPLKTGRARQTIRPRAIREVTTVSAPNVAGQGNHVLVNDRGARTTCMWCGVRAC